jgi:hypothetical protein
MQVQAPTTTTLHRGPIHALLAAFAALIVAGGTLGVIAIVDDNGSTAQGPAVSNVAPARVLDGSPILRGTSVAAESRVLDGSPILRGHVVTHVSSVQGTLRPPVGRPFGFRNVP